MSFFVIVVPGAEQGYVDRAIGPFDSEQEARAWLAKHLEECSDHLSGRGWVDWGNASIVRVSRAAKVLRDLERVKGGA